MKWMRLELWISLETMNTRIADNLTTWHLAKTLVNIIMAEIIITMVATIIRTIINVVVTEASIRIEGIINVNVGEEQRSGIKINRSLTNRHRYVSPSIWWAILSIFLINISTNMHELLIVITTWSLVLKTTGRE